ncbi:MAG: rod shape-determining protein RodA [Candidatus Hatepunaea meridiana]|nr:rod shape-determining protein RodA [Candidatus Hatepunaea meridiana]
MALTNPRVTKSRLAYLDYKLLITVLGLTIIGLLLIYSADHSQNIKSHFTKQIYFSFIGITALITASIIPPRIYNATAYAAYGIGILSLLFVIIAGIIGLGAKRWLIIGGVNVQPSEPVKLAYILVLSVVLSRRRSTVSIVKLLRTIALLGVPPTLLVLMQPDLGTATIFPVITAVMLAWFGLPLKVFALFLLPCISLFLTVYPWFISPLLAFGFVVIYRSGIKWLGITAIAVVCAVATFTAPLAWNQLEEYQQKRLTSFLNPAADPLGSGYQIIQSKVAIGSGGFSGQGFLKGTQTQLRFLPEQHTDFIFALAGEEFGFLGTSIIIILFLLFGWSGYTLATHSKNQFMSFVAIGITSMILYHAVVNIGMVIGILPVTGLPLPFLSYGGSFLLTCFTGTGILISVGLYRRER